MTYKEFKFWLEGFLAGKNELNELMVAEVKEQMKNLVDEPRINHITPISDPNTFPKWQEPHKMNPTCDTGKQLLRDDKRRNGPI
jgi:hypothetical protein